MTVYSHKEKEVRIGDREDAIYDVPVSDALKEWVQDGQDEGLRPASTANRRVFTKTLDTLLTAQSVTRTGEITMPIIKATIRAYAERVHPHTGRTPNDLSVRTFDIKFKCFTNWAWEQRYIKSEKFLGWKLRKADEAHIRVWTDTELQNGIDCLYDFWNPFKHPEIATTWARDEAEKLCTRVVAFFFVALSTGLRREEICGLELLDWNREAHTLTVRRSKGRGHREIPIGSAAEDALNAMLAARAVKAKGGMGKRAGTGEDGQKKVRDCGYLFHNSFGQKLDGHSTLRQIQRYFEWGRTQGMDIPLKFSIHMLRHKAISAMLQVNPEHARLMAGHKSVLTTQRVYGHTLSEDVRVTHAKTDVLERIMVNTRSVRQPRRRRTH